MSRPFVMILSGSQTEHCNLIAQFVSMTAIDQQTTFFSLTYVLKGWPLKQKSLEYRIMFVLYCAFVGQWLLVTQRKGTYLFVVQRGLPRQESTVEVAFWIKVERRKLQKDRSSLFVKSRDFYAAKLCPEWIIFSRVEASYRILDF